MTTISGADARTPRAIADELRKIAAVYGDLIFGSIEQFRANQVAAGVDGAPIDMLDAMFDAAQIVTAATEQAAEKADQHAAFVADTVGSDPSLAGTVAGTYVDPAAL